MKYTIHGYSQEKSIENGLDYLDLGILRWIQDFYPAMKKTIFQNKEYGWFSYSYFLNELPIIGINTKAGLRKRIDKIIEKGFIERTCIKDTDDKLGTRSWIRLTEKMLIIISQTTVSTGSNHSFHPLATTVSTGSNHSFHNSSINNSSINDSSFSNKDKDTASGFSSEQKDIEVKSKEEIQDFVTNFKAKEIVVDEILQTEPIFSQNEIDLITEYILRRKEAYKSKVKNTHKAIAGVLNDILEVMKQIPLEEIFKQQDGAYVHCGTAGDKTKPFQTIKLDYFKNLIQKPTFNKHNGNTKTLRQAIDDNKDTIRSIKVDDYF
jgi:hypothetical protein